MVDKLMEAKLHIVCGSIEPIQHYYNTFIHKTPCMNSSQTRNKHGVGNKLAQEHFQHSAWTTCTYFSKVFNAICLVSVDILKPQDPEFKDIPIQILNDSRYMPHFQDGVHVQACITPQNQVPFSGRKRTPTQNIMDVCNFDMQFIYALAGWEGKYYLVDAGYPQIKGFLGPYKNERYHLQVFRQSGQPEGYKEVFIHAHSSLRSILRDMLSYSFEKQVKIVIATMTLHNYIRRHTEHDRHFAKTTNNYGRVEDNEDLKPHIIGVTRSLEMDACSKRCYRWNFDRNVIFVF
ncbi:hypothetical protein UlMin_020695 [Ulmus minor]